jgi:hypothetical protein
MGAKAATFTDHYNLVVLSDVNPGNRYRNAEHFRLKRNLQIVLDQRIKTRGLFRLVITIDGCLFYEPVKLSLAQSTLGGFEPVTRLRGLPSFHVGLPFCGGEINALLRGELQGRPLFPRLGADGKVIAPTANSLPRMAIANVSAVNRDVLAIPSLCHDDCLTATTTGF